MARKPRVDVAGEHYHVLNRGNGRATIFHSPADYTFFENLLFEKLEEAGVVCHAFTLMPNHWHLLLKTYEDGVLSRLMQNLTQAHTFAAHVKARTIGTGHLYQGRFKSFPIATDNYHLSALKYIERNPVRALLSVTAEDWRWGSAYHRVNKTNRTHVLNADLPLELPRDYLQWVNEPTSSTELEELRGTISEARKVTSLPNTAFHGA